MNADAIRHFYDYHFAENRKTWDWYIARLSQEQYTHEVNYSRGSVRNHLVHLMYVDDSWFRQLRAVEFPEEPYDPADFDDRNVLRAQWDGVEQMMREYLATLTDEMLFEKPIKEPEEDQDLLAWQVLLHVVNHGTDHRAQILRVLSDLGVETGPQDYIFYVYENP